MDTGPKPSTGVTEAAPPSPKSSGTAVSTTTKSGPEKTGRQHKPNRPQWRQRDHADELVRGFKATLDKEKVGDADFGQSDDPEVSKPEVADDKPTDEANAASNPDVPVASAEAANTNKEELGPVPGSVFKARVDKLTAQVHESKKQIEAFSKKEEEYNLSQMRWEAYKDIQESRIAAMESQLKQLGFSEVELKNGALEAYKAGNEKGQEILAKHEELKKQKQQELEDQAQAELFVQNATAAKQKFWKTTVNEILRLQQANPGVSAERAAEWLHNKRIEEERAHQPPPVVPQTLITQPGQVIRNPQVPAKAKQEDESRRIGQRQPNRKKYVSSKEFATDFVRKIKGGR